MAKRKHVEAQPSLKRRRIAGRHQVHTLLMQLHLQLIINGNFTHLYKGMIEHPAQKCSFYHAALCTLICPFHLRHETPHTSPSQNCRVHSIHGARVDAHKNFTTILPLRNKRRVTAAALLPSSLELAPQLRGVHRNSLGLCQEEVGAAFIQVTTCSGDKPFACCVGNFPGYSKPH